MAWTKEARRKAAEEARARSLSAMGHEARRRRALRSMVNFDAILQAWPGIDTFKKRSAS